MLYKIKLKTNYEDFSGDYLLIPKYTKILCLNNSLTYLLMYENDQIKIEKTGNNKVECNILEGEIETQQFVSNGLKLQSYSVATKSLTDHYFLSITVNGESYRTVESLYDMSQNEKAAIVKTGINGGLDVYFGNGNFGYIPENGSSINITYLKTNGEVGNVPSVTTVLGNLQIFLIYFNPQLFFTLNFYYFIFPILIISYYY